jgi:hypothetical protein
MSDPTTSGAVNGTTLDTSPTTTKTTTIGLGAALVGVVGAVFAAVTKDPSSVHWAGIFAGALFGAGGVLGSVFPHVRAMEAEVEHAISTVEAGVVKVDPSATPAVVSAEVRKQLATLFPGATTP